MSYKDYYIVAATVYHEQIVVEYDTEAVGELKKANIGRAQLGPRGDPRKMSDAQIQGIVASVLQMDPAKAAGIAIERSYGPF